MTETILPVSAVSGLAEPSPGVRSASGFADLLLEGAARVDRQITEAEGLARAFALDDSVPAHQVTFALEHARLSFELMVQIRSRLVEGYQEIMRMQL